MKSPVLLITYRRIETTKKVFEQLRQAKPARLYFSSNAADPAIPDETEKVRKVRDLLASIDWPCDVRTLLRTDHVDVKTSVASAIDWFFEEETEGIVLEDDCLPHQHFFAFCDEMLDRFRNTPEVSIVSGSCFQAPSFLLDSSYYFSKYVHIWGWATWRRTWSNYDRDMSFWPKWRESSEWATLFSDRVEERYWRGRFDSAYSGEILTWDYPLLASVWRSGGLTVTPSVNLVSNIGFGPEGTFSKNAESLLASAPVHNIFPLVHALTIQANDRADRFDFDFRFNGRFGRLGYRVVQGIRSILITRLLDPIYLFFRNLSPASPKEKKGDGLRP